jgi:hypothetical protein
LLSPDLQALAIWANGWVQMEFRYIMLEDQTHPVLMSMETCYALGKSHAPFVTLLHLPYEEGLQKTTFVPVVIIVDSLGHS